jgi:putative transposase
MDPGKFYHIYNRGNNQQQIFFEEANYRYFLSQYVRYVSCQVDTYAYCLMPNHFHLLVQIKDDEQTTKVSETFVVSGKPAALTPVEKAFRDFFISYSKSINKRYCRTGSLFQHTFKRKEIAEEAYYSQLIRYIHLNPLKAGFCQDLSQWPYSSFNALISAKATHLQRARVLEWFGGKEAFIEFHKASVNDTESISSLLFD